MSDLIINSFGAIYIIIIGNISKLLLYLRVFKKHSFVFNLTNLWKKMMKGKKSLWGAKQLKEKTQESAVKPFLLFDFL